MVKQNKNHILSTMSLIVAIIIIFIIFIIVLIGYEKDTKPVSATASEPPKSIIEGYYDKTQFLSGGSGLSDQNLADIHIETTSENVILTLSFMSGKSSESQEYASSGVPNYETKFIEGINRLMLKIDGISYLTYRIYEQELNNPVISGIFHQKPVDTSETNLYICTKDDYAYKIEEYNNKLIITFSHIDKISSTSYYVSLNAFTEYENGAFDPIDMYPILSSDGEHALLLSSPFQNSDDAQAFIDANMNNIEKSAPGKAPLIITLSNNTLPTYSQENELLEMSSAPIASINYQDKSYPAMIVDGRFLCWNNDNNDYAYVSSFTIHGAQQGDVYNYEQIFQNVNGTSNPILDYQFPSIISAQYSYDGKYIAFIYQDNKTRMLEIVDLATGKLYIPSDDGFGMDTSSFLFSKNENKLYAITGDYDSKQLLCYDMTDINSIDVYAVIEEQFNESNLAFGNELLYYSIRNKETMDYDIYQLDINSLIRENLTKGNSFILSPDGKDLLINNIQEDGSKDKYSLYIYNIETGNTNTIQNGEIVMDYTWSKTGDRIYYTLYRDVSWDEKYPMALYSYNFDNATSKYMMDLKTCAIYPGNDDDYLLVMIIHQLQDKSVPITYIIR